MKFSLLTIAVFVGLVMFSSCKKETVTNTVTVRDTTVVTDTVKSLTKTQILVQQSPWEIQELYMDTSGYIDQYVRGGINNTSDNYDIVRFTFNADGTGSYTNIFGVTSTLNWLFTTQDQSNIQFNVNPSVYNFTWNLVGISDSSIVQTNYQAANILESSKLIPVQ
jgi:hypothetical protein